MGLFDDLLGANRSEKTYTPKDIREAYASVLFCCANADKDISDEELASLDTLFMNLPVFDNYDEGEYLVSAEKISTEFNATEILKGSFAYMKEQLRPQLFCFCCDLLLADGVMKDDEKDVLERVAQISGIDADKAKKIVEVALIRNAKFSEEQSA